MRRQQADHGYPSRSFRYQYACLLGIVLMIVRDVATLPRPDYRHASTRARAMALTWPILVEGRE